MVYRVSDKKGIMYEINGRVESLALNSTITDEQALKIFRAQSVIDGLLKDKRLEIQSSMEKAKEAVIEASGDFFSSLRNKMAQPKDAK